MSAKLIHQNLINSPTIYTGCDSVYWNSYGISFVNSFKNYNKNLNVHVHIINPSDMDLKKVQNMCNYSYEYISLEEHNRVFEVLLQMYNKNDPMCFYTKNMMRILKHYFTDSANYIEKIHKLANFIIYSNFRYINLHRIWDGACPILCYDTDTICTKEIVLDNIITNNVCCFKKKEYIISAVGFKNSKKFLTDWTKLIKFNFDNNKFYGNMDQKLFNEVSLNYDVDMIENNYCCTNINDQKSFVYTGKGNRKNNNKFTDMIEKWKTK